MTREEYQRNLRIVKSLFPRDSDERLAAMAGDPEYMEDLLGQMAFVEMDVTPMMHSEFPERGRFRALLGRLLGI